MQKIDIITRNAITESGLFDAEWYLQNNPDVVESAQDPLDHYILYGEKESRSPGRLFNPQTFEAYYKPETQDENALLTYINRCADIEIRPTSVFGDDEVALSNSPFFEKEFYLICNQDVAESHTDPVEHYLYYGAREGRNPSSLFLTRKYQELHRSLDESINPLLDYVRRRLVSELKVADFENGIELGYLIPEHFDARWYVEEYDDVHLSLDSAYAHYLSVGKFESRLPKFDPEWYLDEYHDVVASGIDPYQHYRKFGRAECRHPAFNPTWYIEEYADVAASDVNPLEHYQRHGRREGRLPGFNPQFYRNEYPEVSNAGLNIFSHYRYNGRGEGRYPAFHHGWYTAEYSDVRASGLDPYQHYATGGRAQNRLPAPNKGFRIYRARFHNFPAPYDSEYERNEPVSGHTDLKPIAFYLPQFHKDAKNDMWWGDGFTEWTNTKKAKPRFPGHYQPREPHTDIGYYDLSEADAIRRQAELARSHGIYGFCFYHYWFSGERVLEKPFDVLYENKDIDINFCLCWANENWTRTWDGQESDVLIKQDYAKEDALKFIKDIEKYLKDSRYIRIDNKPVILVYKTQIIPDFEYFVGTWRAYWRKSFGEELLIWAVRTDPTDHTVSKCIDICDAVVEFPPHVVANSPHAISYMLDQRDMGLSTNGHFFDYQALADNVVNQTELSELPKYDFYRSVMLGWDNSARREKDWSVWYGFSLEVYDKWLRNVIAYTRETFLPDRRLFFVNAWNEWGEGTYLEPDRKTGYAALNTTSKAIFGLERKPGPLVVPSTHAQAVAVKPSVAIHWHLFYPDLVGEMVSYLQMVETSYDLFITTDTADKVAHIEQNIEGLLPRASVEVVLTPNIGRDVAPFLVAIAPRLQNYDIIGHFHSKRSLTVEWGDQWRKNLLNNLLGSKEIVTAVLGELVQNREIGIVTPQPYPLIAPHLHWSGVEDRVTDILSSVGIDVLLPTKPTFTVGHMFWAKRVAIEPVLFKGWEWSDFEPEEGQVQATLGHCIERIWAYVASHQGYSTREIIHKANVALPRISEFSQKSRACLFVHYAPTDELSEADLYLIRQLSKMSSYMHVVSNSPLSARSLSNLELYADRISLRDNVGLDFAAWRDAIRELGWERLERYDEVVLANNSCYGPVFDFHEMFDRMDVAEVDFWGVSGFPLDVASVRPEAAYLKHGTIPRHIQSYFMVFGNKVVNSVAFYQFWENVKDKTEFMDVVASYETKITGVLEEAGFSWTCLIPEAEELQRLRLHEPRYNAAYNSPRDMYVLRSPLIKKRAWDYAPNEMSELQKLISQLGTYPPHLLSK